MSLFIQQTSSISSLKLQDYFFLIFFLRFLYVHNDHERLSNAVKNKRFHVLLLDKPTYKYHFDVQFLRRG
jgi:hypothetical protein